jgi:hypothetical protein
MTEPNTHNAIENAVVLDAMQLVRTSWDKTHPGAQKLVAFVLMGEIVRRKRELEELRIVATRRTMENQVDLTSIIEGDKREFVQAARAFCHENRIPANIFDGMSAYKIIDLICELAIDLPRVKPRRSDLVRERDARIKCH